MLTELIDNKTTLEESIYRFEQSYLEETGAGNIIKGFDNYIKGASAGSGLGMSSALGSSLGSSAGAGGTTTRRRGQVSDLDRVFSRSSASFMRDSPTPSSANTTPSHALTPTSSGPVANKDREKDKDGVGKASATSSVKGATTKKNKKAAAASAAAAGASGASIATGDANGGGRGREREDDDDGDTSNKQPNKRLKITYGRD